MTLRRLSGDPARAEQWCGQLGQSLGASSTGLPRLLLLLAGTDTAAVPGISSAGSTPAARRQTAAADAELLLLGPRRPRPHALPPLPAGVSPALISHVVVQQLALEPLVVDLGVPVAPAVPHLRCGGGPARCLSGGAAMEPERVQRLLALGRRWGERLAAQGAPVVLAECVPGGTTTAQALLQGLGVEATGLVSGSLRQPAHGLKGQLVAQGLAAAGLGPDPAPQAVLAAVSCNSRRRLSRARVSMGPTLGTQPRTGPVAGLGQLQGAAAAQLPEQGQPPGSHPLLHVALLVGQQLRGRAGREPQAAGEGQRGLAPTAGDPLQQQPQVAAGLPRHPGGGADGRPGQQLRTLRGWRQGQGQGQHRRHLAAPRQQQGLPPPQAVLAAVGDPMQALAAGLLL
ncbi:MAG: hypothetical protein ACKOAP_08940, partial [Vulcanococcus sp.]